jgi:hypothetical protein
MQELADVISGATPIDLTVSAEELQATLASLLDKETAYFANSKADDGVTPLECGLKWSPEHKLTNPAGSLSCFTCPHFNAVRESAGSLICALGREQEETVEQLRGLRLADSLDDELAAAFEREIEACAELAEAHLAHGRAADPVLVA